VLSLIYKTTYLIILRRKSHAIVPLSTNCRITISLAKLMWDSLTLRKKAFPLMIFQINSCGCQQIMDPIWIPTSFINLKITLFKILNPVTFIIYQCLLHSNHPWWTLIKSHLIWKKLKFLPLIMKIANRKILSIILLARMRPSKPEILVRIINRELKKMNSGKLY